MKHIILAIGVLCMMAVSKPSYGENVDERRQTFINDFISYYQAAYEKEDIEYIKQFFSNDALIITETNKLKSVGNELVPMTTKKRPYETIVQNRKEYIEMLRKHFAANRKISIGISNLLIEQHPKHNGIYGVNFYQVWEDVGKSDILENKMPGYIFLMIDFRNNEMEPTVHVRTWQPKSNIQKPAEKYQLTDFRILSTK